MTVVLLKCSFTHVHCSLPFTWVNSVNNVTFLRELKLMHNYLVSLPFLEEDCIVSFHCIGKDTFYSIS